MHERKDVAIPDPLRHNGNGRKPGRNDIGSYLVGRFELRAEPVTSVGLDLKEFLLIDWAISPELPMDVLSEYGVLNRDRIGWEGLRLVIRDPPNLVIVSTRGLPEEVIVISKIVDKRRQRRGNFGSHDFEIRPGSGYLAIQVRDILRNVNNIEMDRSPSEYNARSGYEAPLDFGILLTVGVGV